jgi:hypothetical protein
LLQKKGAIDSFIRKNTIGVRVKNARPTVQNAPYTLRWFIFGPNGDVPNEEEEYPFDSGWKCNIF